jgi:hypothetical protein
MAEGRRVVSWEADLQEIATKCTALLAAEKLAHEATKRELDELRLHATAMRGEIITACGGDGEKDDPLQLVHALRARLKEAEAVLLRLTESIATDLRDDARDYFAKYPDAAEPQ